MGTIIVSIVFAILFIVACAIYIKNMENQYFDKVTNGILVVSMVGSLILLLLTFNLSFFWLMLPTLAVVLLITIIEIWKAEHFKLIESFDGVITDYEIPIKWITNATLRNGLLMHNEKSKVSYITKINDDLYFALMSNGKRKRINKYTLTYKKVSEKFNEVK